MSKRTPNVSQRRPWTVQSAAATWFESYQCLYSCCVKVEPMGVTGSGPQELFFISMAAEMLGMHPQTLRKYERLGLVQPSRTIGSMRLYSREELERLRLIKRLGDESGINLAGVQRLIVVAEAMQRVRRLMDESALTSGAGRRKLQTETRRLTEAVGL